MNSKRNTMQRQLILEAVRELNTHASAEDVYVHVHKKQSSISKATVYRNLKCLTEAGELCNIGNFNGFNRYDHNCYEHQHWVCDKCYSILDVGGDFSDVIDRVRATDDLEITGLRISFMGICANCKKVR